MQRNQDLSSLLSSNVAPNSFAAQLIRAEVEDLTSQITQLHSQLRELEEQVQKRRAVLSPLRRVPPEILGETFSFVLPEILGADGRKQMVDLMLVCKTWHEATLLTPRLWGGLKIWDIGGKIPSFESIISWFSRSGDRPKILEIGESDDNCPHCGEASGWDQWDDQAAVACELLKYPLPRLLAEGPPLDRLSITSATQRCLISVLDSPQFQKAQSQIRPWDSVRSLSLYISSHYNLWYEPPNPSDSIFLRLPSTVTSFRLELPFNHTWEVADEESENRTIPIPRTFLQRLTSFHLMCVWGGNQILAVLQDCVNLETLTIDFDYVTIGPENPFSSSLKRDGIHLPKLQTLKLEKVLTGVEILEFIVAPALVNLDISFSETYKPDGDGLKQGDLTTAANFLLASNEENTILRSLRIRYALMDADDLTHILHILPSLTHLTLENVEFDGYPFQTATYDTPATPPLPQLEVLELVNASEDSPSCALMIDFLIKGGSNQPRPAPRLKQLTMSHKGGMSDMDYCVPRLKKLEKLGVSISITPPSIWTYHSP